MAMHRSTRATDPVARRCIAYIGARCLRICLLLSFAVWCPPAQAHGIVGNRLFPGTLAFEDPAVNDELAFPDFSSVGQWDRGRAVVDDRVGWSFSRLLTPTIAIGVGGGWIHRNWRASQTSGFDVTNVGLKALLYKNDSREVMFSAGASWGVGGSGSQAVGANRSDTVQPGLFFGKGFGDLPECVSWLRPFAVTGAVSVEHPLAASSMNLGIDPQTGQLSQMTTRNVDFLHWGFSVQYSTFYLTNRFAPGKLPKGEPVQQFVPIVEFAFDSANGVKTAATMNPGIAYVANTYQVGVEAIVPLNSEGGRNVGMRAQLLLFLDDLLPSIFGKPIFDR
jgi:hypothetical protein